MIALTALILITLWVVIGIFLGRLLHRLLKLDAKWRALVVWLVVLAPFIQEVLGRIQFAYLCNKHAVVWLSPDWQKVKAAKAIRPPYAYVNWTLIPIKKITTSYVDSADGYIFMKSTRFSSPGGLFQRTFAQIDGSGYSCGPDLIKKSDIYRLIDIDALIKKGEQQ